MAYRQYIFSVDYMPLVKAFPQVRELLLRMKGAGIRISIASSADRDQVNAYEKTPNIGDLTEESSTADDAKRSKPHPDIFDATLKKLKLSPSQVMALGDTPYDPEAAGKAKIRTVSVTTGGWSVKELLNAGCVQVYKDVADLLANFETSALMR